jgi:glycosyltransferase involved in cell wall biosynthesis
LNNTSETIKVCAVIPFFNEKDRISEIIKKTETFVDFIIAVDDGSIDGSSQKIFLSDKIKLISLPSNQGKGAALNKGFIESATLNSTYTVTIDADLQHDPHYIPHLINGLKNNDIIIGNRLSSLAGMPLNRRLSNKITSWLLSVKTSQKIIDSQCGFRAYRTKILKDILPFSNGFEAESEILIIAAKKIIKLILYIFRLFMVTKKVK